MIESEKRRSQRIRNSQAFLRGYNRTTLEEYGDAFDNAALRKNLLSAGRAFMEDYRIDGSAYTDEQCIQIGYIDYIECANRERAQFKKKLDTLSEQAAESSGVDVANFEQPLLRARQLFDKSFFAQAKRSNYTVVFSAAYPDSKPHQ